MSYKTILLHAAGQHRFAGQLALAVDLATRYRAHLVGLAIMPRAIEIPAGVPGASEVIRLDGGRQEFGAQIAEMKAAFVAAAAKQAFSSEWLTEDLQHPSYDELLAGHARRADLVVANALEAGPKANRISGSTERLILSCGRPVLVAPRTNGTHLPVGARVLIAWNGGREATRAVFDSLPILRGARYVKVLTIGEHRANSPVPGPERLAEMLARHDIRAEAELITLPGADVGAALLSAIKAANANLLVMGCYGRSRLYEHALGGATRHLLSESPVPILMSH